MCLILLCGVAPCLHAQATPAPTSVAENFQTIYGKEYKDATVSRVEPDGIVLRTESGISKVYFTELPKEVQERFHYNAAKAAQFTTVQQAAVAQSNAATAAEQQQQAQERQRQAAALAQQRQSQMQQEQMAAQQEQRRLEAQQKQDAKIAAQKQARQQQQRKRRTAGGTLRRTIPGGYEEMSRDGRMGYRHFQNGTNEDWGPAR